MIAIHFDNEIPPEFRSEVDSVIRKYEHLLPSWLWKIIVYPAGTEGDSLCTTVSEVHYRWSYLYLRPLWYSFHKADREAFLVHELMHLVTAEMVQWMENVVKDTIEDKAMQRRLLKELTYRNESVTQELSFVVSGRRCPHRDRKLKDE